MAIDFGEDESCVSDLTMDGRSVSGNRLVGEAIARRLSTPRGRLIQDPDYGTDLTELVNADMSPRDLASLRSGVIAECLKDERINSAEVETTLLAGVLTITVALETGSGPFELVLSVSSVTVELLSVNP